MIAGIACLGVIVFRGGEMIRSWRLNNAALDLSHGYYSQMVMQRDWEIDYGFPGTLQSGIDRLDELSRDGSIPAAERLAWVYIQAGETQTAEELLVKIENPDALLWHALGLQYWQQWDAGSAERVWMHFIAVQPRSLYALFWELLTEVEGPMGELHALTSRLAAWAVEHDPDYLLGYLLAGDVIVHEKPEEAEAWYQQAVRRFPINPQPLVKMAELRLLQQQPGEALAYLEQAFGLGSEEPGAYMAMGQALEQLGQGSQALAWYARALEIVPNHAQYLGMLEAACQQYGPAPYCLGE